MTHNVVNINLLFAYFTRNHFCLNLCIEYLRSSASFAKYRTKLFIKLKVFTMIMKNYFVIKSTGQDICILNLKEAACPCLTRPCLQYQLHMGCQNQTIVLLGAWLWFKNEIKILKFNFCNFKCLKCLTFSISNAWYQFVYHQGSCYKRDAKLKVLCFVPINQKTRLKILLKKDLDM